MEETAPDDVVGTEAIDDEVSEVTVNPCDDGNPCTLDLLATGRTCEHLPTTELCDDGNPCTGPDTCNNGTCLPGGTRDCDDSDPETVDTCDPGTGNCVHGTAGDCPVAIINVGEGEMVIPQTVLHLHGESSTSNAGSINKYEWTVEQPALSSSKFVPTPSYPSPTFEANVSGKYVFHLTVWDEHGSKSCVEGEQEVMVVPDQAIHVELLWTSPSDPNPDDEGPTAGTNLDLHFAHPNASQFDLDGDGKKDPWFDPTWDCFWFYPMQNWGSISSTDDNPSLDRDDVDGGGPENINLDVPEDNKTYAFGVNYWDDNGFGSSYATVRVYIYASLVFEVKDVLMSDHDMWWVGTVEWPSGQVKSKMTSDGGYWITPDYHHPAFYQP